MATTRKAALAATETPGLRQAAEDFLYRQSELLDGKQWQDWIDLFADDGVYWVPAEPGHTHWDGMPAIFAEDKHLMTVRMKRILHPDAWSQKALWFTNHLIGNVQIVEQPAPGELLVHSRFHMMEVRRDNVRHFAGRYTHHLVQVKGDYRIRLQRVDIANGQTAYDYVLQAWV